jgi:hypothetical protein
MEPRRRALAVDFSLGAGAVAVGAGLAAGDPVWLAVIAAVGFATCLAGLYLAEQTPVLALIEEYSPASLVVAFAATLAVGLVLVVGYAVVHAPAAPLLAGMGSGLLGYRIVYGVLAPLPGRRVPDEPPEVEPPPPPSQ